MQVQKKYDALFALYGWAENEFVESDGVGEVDTFQVVTTAASDLMGEVAARDLADLQKIIVRVSFDVAGVFVGPISEGAFEFEVEDMYHSRRREYFMMSTLPDMRTALSCLTRAL